MTRNYGPHLTSCALFLGSFVAVSGVCFLGSYFLRDQSYDSQNPLKPPRSTVESVETEDSLGKRVNNPLEERVAGGSRSKESCGKETSSGGDPAYRKLIQKELDKWGGKGSADQEDPNPPTIDPEGFFYPWFTRDYDPPGCLICHSPEKGR